MTTLQKKIIKYAAIALAIAAILATIIGLSVKVSNLSKENERLSANQIGYLRDLQSASNDVHEYTLTIDDLRMLNDSMTNQVNDLQDALKIKDNQLERLQYLYSYFTKTDTVYFEKTIFLDPELCIDTIIGDEWFSSELILEYPNKITVTPVVISEKDVIVYTTKETVKAPKKCWLARLFQKKHKVTKVYVNENNPYIVSQKNEFVKISK